jgi:hypothetical protein
VIAFHRQEHLNIVDYHADICSSKHWRAGYSQNLKPVDINDLSIVLQHGIAMAPCRQKNQVGARKIEEFWDKGKQTHLMALATHAQTVVRAVIISVAALVVICRYWWESLNFANYKRAYGTQGYEAKV